MKTSTKPKQVKSRKKYLIFGIVILVLLAMGFGGWKVYDSSVPRPLGDRLEYTEKRDYGCAVICDSQPRSTYSYATDMSIEEVIQYFKDASLTRSVEKSSVFSVIPLRDKQGDEFSLYYYTPKDALETLNKTTDQNIIELDAKDYKTAKDAL
jgi:hypothetical protein